MRSDLVLAINALCAERKLPPEVVMEVVHSALVSAYRKNFGAASNIDVSIEPNTGEVRVFAAKEIVDAVEDPKLQISIADARRMDPLAQLGQTVPVETTPRDFGRIAAQAAKQVILQRIKEAERDFLFSSLVSREGEIAHGMVQSIDYHSQDLIISLDGAEALLPAKEQVPTEKYKRGARLRAYVMEVRKGSRGPLITLSRRTPLFLRRLLEVEVPEIHQGTVEIKSIAREPGSRSKVAVHATQPGVDPVGSCVGVRGGRIQSVVTELAGEKIDVVQWNADPAVYIANALSPAKVMNVILDENSEAGRTATVIVPDRQQSLAIGKDGQNARLAAKLTGWRIDIKSATEATEETLGRLQDRVILPGERDLLSLAEAILQKREATGLTPEERELVEDDVEKQGAGDLRWPDQAPRPEAPLVRPEQAEAAQAVLPAEAAPEPEQPAAPAGVQPGAVAPAGITAAPAASETPSLEGVPAEGTAPELEELEPVQPTRVRFAEEAAHVPTFEGEPVEESSGWVRTETQQDLYSGWQDVIDVSEYEEEWDREDVDLEESPAPGKKAKAKKKKSGKSRYLRSSGREEQG